MTNETAPCLVVVEDNPADVQLLEFALTDAGLNCDLTTISDGLRAIEWVRERAADPNLHRPPLLILDLNLPMHDGVEILETMHRSSLLAHVPVLVLSSSPSPRDAARVSAFPNTKYMTKPVDFDGYAQLSTVIRELLNIPAKP